MPAAPGDPVDPSRYSARKVVRGGRILVLPPITVGNVWIGSSR